MILRVSIRNIQGNCNLERTLTIIQETQRNNKVYSFCQQYTRNDIFRWNNTFLAYSLAYLVTSILYATINQKLNKIIHCVVS